MSAAEEEVSEDEARQLRREMVRALELTPPWSSIFERVPRHVFVPRIVGCWPPDPDGSDRFVLDAERDRHRWLELVYSNRLLVIEDEGERLSSSSMPSAMARFLHLLDVQDGNTVLEIGTGSGYNAALLCERLGADRVTSIDVDAELVGTARRALASCGYFPLPATADGALGYPPAAPYDRIIATCSVPRIPRPWLDQLAPGGVIVAPMASGLLVSLHRQKDGSLVGRGDPAEVGFMPLRSSTWPEPEFAPFAAGDVETRPLTRPDVLDLDSTASFYAELQIHDVALAGEAGERMLGGRTDGSWARVLPDEEGGHVVVQAGPRHLWDEWEAALDEWAAVGSPGWERFGLTVRPDGSQFIWLDSPDSEYRWEL